MIALLDPALLLPRGPAGSQAVDADLRRALSVMRDKQMELPQIYEYWHAIIELTQSLARAYPADRGLKDTLHQLRGRSSPPRDLPSLPADQTHVWGFKFMFGPSVLPAPWEDRMKKAALRALLSRRPTYLLVRQMAGRNVHLIQGKHPPLREVLRWHLHLTPRGWDDAVEGRKPLVPCVWTTRQVDVPWTARFDPRLPGSDHGARYPFCPPDRWWKKDTPAHATIASKPAFLDRHGNGWARPNIPGGRGHHFDVFVRRAGYAAQLGLDQLNIVEFGAQDGDRVAGDIHHVPSAKAGALRADPGWSC